MKHSSVTNIRFQGNFREKRRASPRRVLGFVAGIAVLGGLVYLLLYAPTLTIKNVELHGFERTNRDQVQAVLWGMVNERRWGLQPYRDILFFNTAHAQASLEQLFPSLVEITIKKKYPHSVVVSGIERTPAGIWCQKESCVYFDASGASWGRALPSSGALLTAINDLRSDAQFDREIVFTMQKVAAALPPLNVAMKSITIPDDVPAEFTVQTSSYAIRLALDHPIEQQLETLRVFLESKKDDPAFHPQQYLDLRVAGRVYYK